MAASVSSWFRASPRSVAVAAMITDVGRLSLYHL